MLCCVLSSKRTSTTQQGTVTVVWNSSPSSFSVDSSNFCGTMTWQTGFCLTTINQWTRNEQIKLLFISEENRMPRKRHLPQRIPDIPGRKKQTIIYVYPTIRYHNDSVNVPSSLLPFLHEAGISRKQEILCFRYFPTFFIRYGLDWKRTRTSQSLV